MNKSILVIDTPSNGCSSCGFSVAKFVVVEVDGIDTKQFVYECPFGKGVVLKNTVNPQCPLQPVAPLLEALEDIFDKPFACDEQYTKLKSALGGNK